MISQLTKADCDAALADLTEILHACVHAGASVGFILPFSQSDAAAFWTDSVFPAVRSGALDLFVARDGDRIVGTVQLVPSRMPNQPHRADVAKLLVHPDARRQGLGRSLMGVLEDRARSVGKSLLVLDTRSTDPSLILYRGMGFSVAGEIPDYCVNPFDQQLEPTTYMFKPLR